MRQQSVGSALSSADPVQVTAKVVSLIDTVRYINWPRRLVLYIYIGFVGGFPGIVWRLQRSCKTVAAVHAGRPHRWVAFGSLILCVGSSADSPFLFRIRLVLPTTGNSGAVDCASNSREVWRRVR